MSIEAYNIITHYCRDNNKDLVVRNHSYCICIEHLQQALEKLDSSTPMKLETTSSALLTEEAIKGYVSRAETFSEDIIKTAVAPYITDSSSNPSFLMSVAASVVASFIFTAIIIATYWMGQDYIKSLLASFTQ